MANFDDDNEKDEDSGKSKLSKKKMLIFLLPVLIVIGLAVGLYHNFGTGSKSVSNANYTTVTKPAAEGSSETKTTIFYDLPAVRTQIKTDGRLKEFADIKITIELAKPEDIPTIEALLSRFNDIIITHTSELTSEEISGANGLYWLKEELLYRINLVASPIKIDNLDFKSFEVQKAD